MLERIDMEKELLNKFTDQQRKSFEGYKKKIKGLVNSALEAEYNMVIKGVMPKVKKVKSYSYKKDE